MRVALVTGAARGIGAATVVRLAAGGAHVVALDWCRGTDDPVAFYAKATRDDLNAVAAHLPGLITPVVADVRDRSALEAVVDDIVARHGRLDVAVAAAGLVAGGHPLWETPEAELDLLLDVDAKGVWNTAAAAVPAMLSGPDPRGCRFVAVASAAGTTGLFHLAAYCAAKHAVVGIVKGLAADLRGTGITACAVSPGSTDTAMLAATAALYGVTNAQLATHQHLQRAIDPDEIAATISFCASLDGGVVNGSVIHADGGFTG